jgi:hypothetical protein
MDQVVDALNGLFTSVRRPATFVVAASNASAGWKNFADQVCTGTADNVHINAALAALPAQGGTVLLSDGTFSLSAPIIPTVNNSRLLGQGPQATLIQAAVGANCNGYQYNSATQLYNLIFCAIEGMTFNGNYNAGAGNTSGYGCRIDYSLASYTFWDFYLRDVWFNNWANDGYYSTAGHGYVLDHVLGEYCGGNGCNIAGGAFNDSPPRIVNGTFKINGLAGVTIGATNGQSVTDAVVLGNEITSNSGPYGLILSGSGQKAIGNKIGNNRGTGVHITGGNEGIEFIGNTVAFNATHGLLLDDANCTVDGNFFLSNSYVTTGGTTGAADEINVAHGTYSAAGNFITGNVMDCASSSRYGINLADATDTAGVLAANRIINPVTAPVRSLAPDTLFIATGGATGGPGLTSAWAPSDNGLLVCDVPPNEAQGSATLIAGTLYLTKLMIRYPLTITNLWWDVFAAGLGSSTGSFTGLYSSAGTLLTGSSDIAAANLLSTGPKMMAVTTPQALAPGTFVWAALLVNMATTQPGIFRSVSAASLGNINLAASAYRYCTNGTGLTTLPGSITPASNSQGAAFALCAWGS